MVSLKIIWGTVACRLERVKDVVGHVCDGGIEHLLKEMRGSGIGGGQPFEEGCAPG